MALPCESLGISGDAGGGTDCAGFITGVAGTLMLTGGAVASRSFFLVDVIEAGML
jgi:hypothetical protein